MTRRDKESQETGRGQSVIQDAFRERAETVVTLLYFVNLICYALVGFLANPGCRLRVWGVYQT